MIQKKGPNACGKGRLLGLAKAMRSVGVPLTKRLGFAQTRNMTNRTSLPEQCRQTFDDNPAIGAQAQ